MASPIPLHPLALRAAFASFAVPPRRLPEPVLLNRLRGIPQARTNTFRNLQIAFHTGRYAKLQTYERPMRQPHRETPFREVQHDQALL